jgi:hypothetical protein
MMVFLCPLMQNKIPLELSLHIFFETQVRVSQK